MPRKQTRNAIRKKNIWVAIYVGSIARDYLGAVSIGRSLKALGYIVSIFCDRVGQYSIREWILEYRPDVLVLPAVPFGYRFHSYFRAKGVTDYKPFIVIVPTEFRAGLLKEPTDQAPTIPDVASYVDLVLCINRYERTHLLKVFKTLSKEKTEVVGMPRFDFFFQSRKRDEKFYTKYAIPKDYWGQKVVLISSRAGAIDFIEEDLKRGRKSRVIQRGLAQSGETEETVMHIVAIQKHVRDLFIKATERLAEAFDDHCIVFRLHPSEKPGTHYDRLKTYKNVVIMDPNKGYIGEVLSFSDVMIGFRCTSFIEATLAGVPIIQLLPEPSVLSGPTDTDETTEGLDGYVVSSVESIKRLLPAVQEVLDRSGRWPNNKDTDQSSKIADHVEYLDGQSSRRVSERIDYWLGQSGMIEEIEQRDIRRRKEFIAKATNQSLQRGRFFRQYDPRLEPFKATLLYIKQGLKVFKRISLNFIGRNVDSIKFNVDVEKDLSSKELINVK